MSLTDILAPVSRKARPLMPLPRASSLPVRCTPGVHKKDQNKHGPLLWRADSLPNPSQAVPDAIELAETLGTALGIEQAQSKDDALSLLFEQGVQSGHIKVSHDPLRSPNVGSMPGTPGGLAAPLSEKARQFIPLPRQRSPTTSLPSQVPITHPCPTSSLEPRFWFTSSSAHPQSFFGTLFRVMARLHWPATTGIVRSVGGADSIARGRFRTVDIPEGPAPDLDDAESRSKPVISNRNMRNVMQKRQRGHQNRTFGVH